MCLRDDNLSDLKIVRKLPLTTKTAKNVLFNTTFNQSPDSCLIPESRTQTHTQKNTTSATAAATSATTKTVFGTITGSSPRQSTLWTVKCPSPHYAITMCNNLICICYHLHPSTSLCLLLLYSNLLFIAQLYIQSLVSNDLYVLFIYI